MCTLCLRSATRGTWIVILTYLLKVTENVIVLSHICPILNSCLSLLSIHTLTHTYTKHTEHTHRLTYFLFISSDLLLCRGLTCPSQWHQFAYEHRSKIACLSSTLCILSTTLFKKIITVWGKNYGASSNSAPKSR